ncbi:MAG: helix-turn-helix domain-containing protein [Nanoarchaeota archaeon]
MIVHEEFLKKLRSAFDLNIYEAKIWTALLSKGVATAGELSEISDVPRSRAYDVLESLEKRGFIIMKIGKPIRYLAIKPEEIFRRVRNQLQQRAEEQIKILENIENTDVLKELQLLFTQGIENIDPSNISGAIKGRKNIYENLYEMLSNAEKNIIIATTSKGILRKHESIGNLLKKLNDKGIKVKIIAPQTESNKSVLVNMSKFAKIKNANINARFVIVDGKETMFMTNHDDNVHENFDVGIWVKSPFFVSALENLFNSFWEKTE